MTFKTLVLLGAALGVAMDAQAQAISPSVLADSNPATAEVSTEDLRAILAAKSAILLDTRPHLEWAISHIPGALNVAPKPGMPASMYTSDVAEITRLVAGDKSRALILYCNGPFCGKSKRVSEDLIKAGYTNVRRYQLGAPVWRALGGVMVIEPDGVRYVHAGDRTAVWIDARASDVPLIPGARSIPRNKVLPGKDVGEIKLAKDDGRLPMNDHNTRIVVFGADAAEARAVAEAIAREAFHNVVYFEGSPESLKTALAQKPAK